ncbi:MAG TPA: hypothetical protein VFZ77_02170 [Acidimicrobiales bacterium]
MRELAGSVLRRTTRTETPPDAGAPGGAAGAPAPQPASTAVALDEPGAPPPTAPGDGAAARRASAAQAEGRLAGRVAMALTLLPFGVAAVLVLVVVRGDYHPISDHALIELQTRGVGRHEVLVGLFSRDTWNHPGPAQFYLLAPFYWLVGGMSVGISIGALAVNAASIAAMALVGRRLGGTPLMLSVLLCSALLMRATGPEFLRDPWNCYMTVLPYGLLVMLAWAMWRGQAWALPAGAAVAAYLAHAHVGFVVLALPLVGWGLVGLGAASLRTADPDERGPALRRSLRALAVTAAVAAAAAAPVAADAVRNSPANTAEIVRYFRDPGEAAHTLVEGWRVMVGQLGVSAEWLTVKRAPAAIGQSPFIYHAPVPWLLLAFVAAAAVLWRRRVPGAAALVATLVVTLALGVVAVARTVGPAFDYRLRWTFVPGMLAGVVVCWGAWTALARRWPRVAPRALTVATLAVTGVVSAVNVVTAGMAGTPQGRNSEAVQAISEQVVDALPAGAAPVLVTDAGYSGAWHARGLVLQLERHGVDVGVEENRADEYGRHRVLDEPPGTVLVVTRDEYADQVGERPGMRPIAEWRTVPEAEADELRARLERLDADLAAGRISYDEGLEARAEVLDVLSDGGASHAWRVTVFVHEAVPVAEGAS